MKRRPAADVAIVDSQERERLRRRTVVYVVQNLQSGGAERRLVLLLAALDRSRYRPVLVCVDGLGELADDVRSTGVEPLVLGRRSRWDASGVLRLARVVRRERAAIVHGWLFLANAYARVGGRLGGAPVIVAAEGGAIMTSSARRHRAMRLVEASLSRMTDAYVANSAATADGLRSLGVDPAKIDVVRNGVVIPDRLDAEERARRRTAIGVTGDAPLVVMVARLDPAFKDHDGFLRVIAELPGVAAAVIGDGPGRAAAEERARALGIADRVVFTGFRPDARSVAAAADVSVLLTYSEGLSNTVLESLAAAVPVVATDVPANREALRDGVDGLLVPVGDVPATAAAVRGLIEDPAQAARLGEAGRRGVLDRFSPESQAEKTVALYDRLLAAKRS